MNLKFLTLLLCASVAGGAHAQPAAQAASTEAVSPSPFEGSPQTGLQGVKLGQSLDWPVCSDPGQTTDSLSALPAPHNNSETSCRISPSKALPSTGVVLVRVSRSAHAAYAGLRQDFKVDLVAGKVAGISVMTLGPNGPERVLNDLTERFGRPTSQRTESGTGASFRPATAEWRLSDGVVNFSGGAPGYPVAVVEIESLEFYDRPVPRGPGAGPGPSLIVPQTGERDHAARAAAILIAMKATGVSLHHLRMILELDEAALEKYPPSDRQTLRKLQDDYSSIVKGAEFAMTPLGRKLLGVRP